MPPMLYVADCDVPQYIPIDHPDAMSLGWNCTPKEYILTLDRVRAASAPSVGVESAQQRPTQEVSACERTMDFDTAAT